MTFPCDMVDMDMVDMDKVDMDIVDNDNEYYDNQDDDNEDNNKEDMPCLRSLSPMSIDHLADLSRTLGLVTDGKDLMTS